jgi:hypothetical protein
MSDDDWLPSRPDPEDSQRQPVALQQVRESASGGYQQSEAQRPRLLQRPKDSEDPSDCVLDRPPPKTLKQKEAEYAAARARIFGSKEGPPQGAGRGAQVAAGRGRQGRGGRGRVSAVQGMSAGGGSGRRNNFDDAGDPDYDRNPALYGARLAPSDFDDEPYAADGVSRYQPPTYESEFPSLGS